MFSWRPSFWDMLSKTVQKQNTHQQLTGHTSEVIPVKVKQHMQLHISMLAIGRTTYGCMSCMQASNRKAWLRVARIQSIQQDDRCLSGCIWPALGRSALHLCPCAMISAVYTSTKGVQVQKVYSCMQGDMEGVRQQAEQHLAAAHAEARSTIQKAQATAADLQVSNFAHLCRAACISGCVCVCVCVWAICSPCSGCCKSCLLVVHILLWFLDLVSCFHLACGVSFGVLGWLNPRVQVLHEPGRVSAAQRNKAAS